MRFLVRADLDRMPHLGAVDDVRNSCLVCERNRIRGLGGTERMQIPANDSAQCEPRDGRCSTQHRPQARTQHRFSHARRQRFLEHGIEPCVQCLILLLPGAHALRVFGMGCQISLDFGPPCFRQQTVNIGVQLGFGDRNLGHFTTFNAAAGMAPPASNPRNRSRARDSRDITVPTGIPSAPAVFS